MQQVTGYVRALWHPVMPLIFLAATIYMAMRGGLTTVRVIAFVVQGLWLAISLANQATRGRVVAWIYRKD